MTEKSDRIDEISVNRLMSLSQESVEALNFALADYYLLKGIKLSVSTGQIPKDLIQSYIENKIRIYEDLARAGNMFSYNYDSQRAKIFGWKALRTSMELINFMIDYDINYVAAINQIKRYFSYCRSALLSTDDEYKQVISLKLNELEKYYEELTDNIPDDPNDVHVWTETQNQSIAFMLPKTPPSFMLLTPDGRLITFIEATEDLTSQNTPINHLVVSLLSATREMFLQTSFSGSGLIEEIDMGEHALIIKSTDIIVVVCIVTFPFDEIRDFVSTLTKSIDQRFGYILRKWFGDSDTIAPMVEYARGMIKENVVGKF